MLDAPEVAVAVSELLVELSGGGSAGERSWWRRRGSWPGIGGRVHCWWRRQGARTASSGSSPPAGSTRSTCPGATARSRTSGCTRTGAAGRSAASCSAAFFELAREEGAKRESRSGCRARSFENLERDRGVLPRQRLRAAGPADAEEAVSAEMLLVEQRVGDGNGDSAHWILEGGRILPGVDDNRRMEELRRGMLRHAGVRAVRRRRRQRRRRADPQRAARARLPGSAGGGLGGAGGDAGADAAWIAARHTGLRRPGRGGAGGGADGDHRCGTARRRRPLHLRALPPARPPRRPGLVRRLLLPQHRCGGGADPARGGGAARSGSSTSTCTTPTAPRRSSRRWPTPACTRCTPRR